MQERTLKNFKVSSEIHSAVKDASLMTGMRMQAIVERALVHYLKEMKRDRHATNEMSKEQ